MREFVHVLRNVYLHVCVCLLQIDVLSSCGSELPASVWTCRQSHDPAHCLVLLEPVERISAHVSFLENVGKLHISSSKNLLE